MQNLSTPSPDARIFVTGHRGMVGSALVRRLQAGGYTNILTRSRTELDLLDQRAVQAFLAEEKPDTPVAVLLRAALRTLEWVVDNPAGWVPAE